MKKITNTAAEHEPEINTALKQTEEINEVDREPIFHADEEEGEADE